MKKLMFLFAAILFASAIWADSNSCKISGHSDSYVYVEVSQFGATDDVIIEVNAYGSVKEGAVTVEFDWKCGADSGHQKETVYFSNGKGQKQVGVACDGLKGIKTSNVTVYNAICRE